MTLISLEGSLMPKQWNRLIVALDLEDKAKIKRVVDKLYPKGVKFKIGSIAFTKFGPDFVRGLIKKGADIFLDLKLYDIPNTMKQAAAIIAQMGCWAFTVHVKAGKEVLPSRAPSPSGHSMSLKLHPRQRP